MPVSLLWAVDVYGRVYSLSTAGQQWEQCRDAQMEFKRVTAAKQCCWGIACDNNIYLNVHASDLPVRYQEETYENQVGPICQSGSHYTVTFKLCLWVEWLQYQFWNMPPITPKMLVSVSASTPVGAPIRYHVIYQQQNGTQLFYN